MYCQPLVAPGYKLSGAYLVHDCTDTINNIKRAKITSVTLYAFPLYIHIYIHQFLF